MRRNTDWLANCGWGVLCHYLAPLSEESGAEMSAEAWDDQVSAFDVEGLAEQLHSIGVPYFFITLGQNSGHYLSPNATYDGYVGLSPSKCATRDLITDLSKVLAPRGIRLLVYLPSGAPAADPDAVRQLGWEWGFKGRWPDWGGKRTGKRLAEFQRRWEKVIREWSLRWGTRVSGWWIDGCYFADEMYRRNDEPNFRSLADALKAGSPEAIVAFNPGVKVPIVCHSEYEDYTAGEISDVFPICPGPWVSCNGHGARYHVLSYLGELWGAGEPRFPDEFVIGYTKQVASKGGAVTWDVPIEPGGMLSAGFLEQLAALSAEMRAWRKGLAA